MMRARLGLCGNQLRLSFSKRTGPPSASTPSSSSALPSTPYFLLPTSYFLLPTSYFLLPTFVRPLVQLCAPSPSSSPSASNLPLPWPIRFTPRCSPILLVHHLSKTSVIAQQPHPLTETMIMIIIIHRYRAAQGYLASHSVHQTPEHYKKCGKLRPSQKNTVGNRRLSARA